MSTHKLTLVFVHGYSVTKMDTYGELPQRLRKEAQARGLDLKVEEIFLGKYISFQDEVTLSDVARAFHTALKRQLQSPITSGGRFACITHSTGGPVVREWFQTYYAGKNAPCPMSHLIMLAPANFGSALAQLGKGRLSRIKTWFQGVEPGQGVLNWLELGSLSSWQINSEWIANAPTYMEQNAMFPFVLSGQTIDRKVYDHLNSYTGESGSDGVVRLAAANLNSTYIKLNQKERTLEMSDHLQLKQVAFRIIRDKAHGGKDIGIMRSVKAKVNSDSNGETIDVIFDCLAVSDKPSYDQLRIAFATENDKVQQEEKVEVQKRRLAKDRHFIHDRYFQVIFKIVDETGSSVSDFDLLLTGPGHSPDTLPEGFFMDRQRNQSAPNTLTYYLNYDLMKGCPAVLDKDGSELRPAQPGIKELGLELRPRPDKGFVRYTKCGFKANVDLMNMAVKPNSTTLLEIHLKRLVSDKVFELFPQKGDKLPKVRFKGSPGTGLVD